MDLHYTHNAGSMIGYHKKLTSSGYRALIYRYEMKYFDGIMFRCWINCLVFITVATMICVFHLLELKHGLSHWVMRSLMSGDLGGLMPKSQGCSLSLSLSLGNSHQVFIVCCVLCQVQIRTGVR